MSENTKIEWTDHTFNPWWGCQKAGPGCDHCYAETLDKRTGGQHWGPGAERRRTSAKNWNDPVRWNKQADAFFAEYGRRQRVFCASMADVFDNAVPQAWRNDLFRLISETPNLDWLLLTKRIGNANDMISEALFQEPRLKAGDCRAASWPWPNVWLGATIVNQEEADRDIPKLLAMPAQKRFLSMEPLLGPVDLGLCDCDKGSRPGPDGVGGVTCARCNGTGGRMLDWVIVGGESGLGARPMHPDWARNLRDECEAAGVSFLFKQWGEWTPGENVERHRGTIPVAILWNNEWQVSNLNLATDGGHIDDEPDLYRVGKKEAGRLLDGRNWDGYPA